MKNKVRELKSLYGVCSILIASGLFIQTGLASLPLNQPFNPGEQDTVMGTVDGIHSLEAEVQTAETFNGKLYYRVYSDGTGTPSKVYCYDPSSMSQTVLLSASGNSFRNLKMMQGALFISHTDGRLWKYDGAAVSELTGLPFDSANHVTAMAEFNGKLYFGTSAGKIYESADGSSFDLKTTITTGYRISGLVAWKGYLYGANAEDYDYSSKIFRSVDGAAWTTVTNVATYGFHAFVATPEYLYLSSVESAGGLSFAVRSTSDGTNWPTAFYTTSEGKITRGGGTYFSATGRAYYTTHDMSGVARLVPLKDGAVESRVVLAHQYSSLVEVDGQLYGIGRTNSSGNPDSAPTSVGVLGAYRNIGFGEGVNLSGSVVYSGPQTGLVYVVVSSQFATRNVTLATPGAFVITNVPRYWACSVSAFIDSNSNGVQNAWEAQGQFAGNPVAVVQPVSGIGITLSNPDTDNDSLPDWWEILRFSNLAQSGGDDPDGDGVSNSQEYLDGTNPMVFDIGPMSIWTAVEVGWRSVSGTNYQVQWSVTSEPGVWHNVGSPIPGNGTTNTLLQSTRDQEHKLYRVILAP